MDHQVETCAGPEPSLSYNFKIFRHMVNGLHLYLFTKPVSGYRQVIIMHLVLEEENSIRVILIFPYIPNHLPFFVVVKEMSQSM